MHESRKVGLWGEILAVRYLRDRDYEILNVNFRAGHAEADIIAADGKLLCIAEVKTRSEDALLPPAESVDIAKQQNLELAGGTARKLYPNCTDIRYDIIEVYYRDPKHYRINHIKNAF